MRKKGVVIILVCMFLINICFVLGDTLVMVPRIVSPQPANPVITDDGTVSMNASLSYLVNRLSDADRKVFCLVGLCPEKTKFPDAAATDNETVNEFPKPLNVGQVEFVWNFDGEIYSKKGNEAQAYDFIRRYAPSPIGEFYWLKLMMKYENGTMKTNSTIEIPFKVRYTKTVCSTAGRWVTPKGGEPFPYHCENNGEYCCPESQECNTATGECVDSEMVLCAHYKNQEDCNADRAGVAEYSIKRDREDGKTCPQDIGYDNNGCQEYLTGCGCAWDAAIGNCTVQVNVSSSCGVGTYPEIGKCIYTESTSDTCEDDDYLTYSWTAEWKWHAENIAWKANTAQGNGNYYDPLNQEAACKEGSKSIPCPSSIKLPFFGIYQLLISVMGIAVIYGFLKRKEDL
jgi:hypothetical protein